MAVSFLNFNELHDEAFQHKIWERFSTIIKDNSFIEGPYNCSFEERLAKMCQAKHCLLVANGTDALEISLMASGIQPGDKVGVAGVTFYASAEAIINCGAVPVFIDVDPQTGLICPDSLARVAQKFTLKAVIPVHIYGHPAPIFEIEKICKSQGIFIIEDAAQAIGAHLKNTPVGGSGNLTTFSFYPTKNLSALGDAGAILTNDDHLANQVRLIRNHGRGPNGWEVCGRNSRCDHLNASVLDLKLNDFPVLCQKRKDIAKAYAEILGHLPIKLPLKEFIENSAWHLYPILLENNDQKIKLNDHLRKKQIGTALFYERSLKQEPVLQHYEGEFAQANEFVSKVLCLPMHPFLTPQNLDEVATAMNGFFS